MIGIEFLIVKTITNTRSNRMRQYCRYCAFCFEADDYRCSAEINGQELHMDEKQISRANNCKEFKYCDLGDVITGRQYKPREKKEKRDNGQLPLFES